MITKNSVIYQIVTDRFNNDTNDLYKIIKEPNYNNIFSTFLGGTFKGIENKLDYLTELGITHILLSPVQESTEYHGYNQLDSRKINNKFGTEHDLKNLINEAHKKDIQVIMDYVTTHVSSNHPIFKEKGLNGNKNEKEWFIFQNQMHGHEVYGSYFDEIRYKLTSGNSKFVGKIKEINPQEYLGYFGREDSPLLNLENPEVVEWHKENIGYWIKEFGFDDVRLDSGFIQPRGFISEIQNHLNLEFGNIDILSEYWGFEISHGRGYGFSGADCYGYSNGEFDLGSTLEFNFRSNEDNFFHRIINNYYHFKDILRDHKSILSISNHDIPRFNGGKNLQKILSTLQYTLPSIPLIYYGEEIGMKQFNDGSDRIAQSRDPMRFDLHDEDMFNFYKNLNNFRKDNLFGNVEILEAQINDNGQLFTYRLNFGDSDYYVFLNKENRKKPVKYNELFNGTGFQNLNIPTQSFIDHDGEFINLEPESTYILRKRP